MATVSISEAARLARVSRKTIQRHISSGKLSATLSQGADTSLRQVEISELMRVYGQLDAPVPATSAPQVPSLSAPNDALAQVVEAQKETIDLLKRNVDELTIEKRELRAQVAGLLEYRKPEKPHHQPNRWLFVLIGMALVGILVLILWYSH